MHIPTDKGARWQLTTFFPAVDATDLVAFKQSLRKQIAQTARDIRQQGVVTDATAGSWQAIVLDAETAGARLHHLETYLHCLSACDASNPRHEKALANLARIAADHRKNLTRIERAVHALDQRRFQAFLDNACLKDIAYPLQRLRIRGGWHMSKMAEDLTEDLGVDGLGAWARLYDRLSGAATFTLTHPDGTAETLPMSQWRGVLSHPDRTVGKRAFEAGIKAWQQLAPVCAAALNAICGTRLTLGRHRKAPAVADLAAFEAGLKPKTIAAMYEGIADTMAVAQDFYRIKASFFGRQGIWFFEREAPLPLAETRRETWTEATAAVHQAFLKRYPALAGHFRQLVASRWIDSTPAENRRPGAFCICSPLTGEQRIFMTYTGIPTDRMTLAHETGHAWHHQLVAPLRPFLQAYPMPLAETAATFAEHLLTAPGAGTGGALPATRLAALDRYLSNAAMMLLDITTRFEFEKHLYEKRRRSELSVEELCCLMTDTQRRIFGSALLPDGQDALLWASKPHFYMPGLSFYNFPYTFGFLLARRIYEALEETGPEILGRYEALLRTSAAAPVEDAVFNTMGFDISRPHFWEEAVRGLQPSVAEYGRLINRHLSGGRT